MIRRLSTWATRHHWLPLLVLAFAPLIGDC